MHQLHRDSILMFENILHLVVSADDVNVSPSEYKSFAVEENLLGSARCGYLVGLEDDIMEIEDQEERRELRRQLRSSTVAMIKHLQKCLPFDNELLKNLAFLDPDLRGSRKNVPAAGTKVAKILKRFTEEQMPKVYNNVNLLPKCSWQDDLPLLLLENVAFYFRLPSSLDSIIISPVL